MAKCSSKSGFVANSQFEEVSLPRSSQPPAEPGGNVSAGTMWRNLRAPDVLGSRTSTPAAAAGDSSYAGDGGKASRSRLYIAILTVIRRGPSSSSMTPPLQVLNLAPDTVLD